jgi:hypothetical protein
VDWNARLPRRPTGGGCGRGQTPSAGLRHVASDEALEAAPAVPCPDDPGARIEPFRGILVPYGASIPPILQSYLGQTRDVWCGETAGY